MLLYDSYPYSSNEDSRLAGRSGASRAMARPWYEAGRVGTVIWRDMATPELQFYVFETGPADMLASGDNQHGQKKWTPADKYCGIAVYMSNSILYVVATNNTENLRANRIRISNVSEKRWSVRRASNVFCRLCHAIGMRGKIVGTLGRYGGGQAFGCEFVRCLLIAHTRRRAGRRFDNDT